MRKIKFRAWDTWGKCWFDSFYVDQGGEVNYSDWDGMERDDNRFILVQYTGLKDKNGKEIYEGDIVRVKRQAIYVYEDYEAVGVIKFGFHQVYFDSDLASTGDAYGFYIEVAKDDSGSRSYSCDVGNSMIGEYVTLENTKSIGVIGNIYENPELLSDTVDKPKKMVYPKGTPGDLPCGKSGK